MAKDRECLSEHGRAAFYAAIWDDLRNAAFDCGWALGLHGSLAKDMDIMAMPWTEEAKPVEDMIQSLINCFTPNPFEDLNKQPHYNKPNNRVVYTIRIWKDLYLDVNIIQLKDERVELLLQEIERLKEHVCVQPIHGLNCVHKMIKGGKL